MGAMNGGLYQLLLQSKLLITAVMMKQLKGTTQSGSAAFFSSHVLALKAKN